MTNMNLKPVALGVFLALATLFLGELHGLSFGAKEDAIKASFTESAKANAAALGSEENMKKATDDAWKYLKRAHEHYMGLGAMGMVLCLFVGMSPAKDVHKTIVSAAVGFGALVYPLFWTLVSCKAAAVGGHAAKESLAIMAQAGAGVGFLGLLGVILIAFRWAWAPRHY